MVYIRPYLDGEHSRSERTRATRLVLGLILSLLLPISPFRSRVTFIHCNHSVEGLMLVTRNRPESSSVDGRKEGIGTGRGLTTALARRALRLRWGVHSTRRRPTVTFLESLRVEERVDREYESTLDKDLLVARGCRAVILSCADRKRRLHSI